MLFREESLTYGPGDEQRFFEDLGSGGSRNQEALRQKHDDNARRYAENAAIDQRNKVAVMSGIATAFGWPIAVLGAIWKLFSMVSKHPGPEEK